MKTTIQYGLADAWGSDTTDQQAASYRKRFEQIAERHGYEVLWTNDPYAGDDNDRQLAAAWFGEAMEVRS